MFVYFVVKLMRVCGDIRHCLHGVSRGNETHYSVFPVPDYTITPIEIDLFR